MVNFLEKWSLITLVASIMCFIWPERSCTKVQLLKKVESMGIAPARAKKSHKLDMLFNNSAQEMDKCKLSQQLLSSDNSNDPSESVIVALLQDIVAY